MRHFTRGRCGGCVSRDSSFRYARITGIGRDARVSRRAPSSAIKVVNSGRETLYWPSRDGVAGGVAFPEPDVSNIGGISAWMKVAELAAAHGLPVTSHGVHELHVHLLAAVPNASDLEVYGFATECFVRQPPLLECGAALPPDRPGHGVEFDLEPLEPDA